MATRRRSTATKSAKAATTETVTQTPSVVTKVTKYSKPIEIKKVTETPTKTRRFATSRPDEPKISLEEYVSDDSINSGYICWTMCYYLFNLHYLKGGTTKLL